MSCGRWSSLGVMGQPRRTFRRAGTVVNHVLYLVTLLSELVEVRVCVAYLVSVTLFLHCDSAV